ncbi:class A beta-lactamase [Microbacterium sp. ET2]|uniref:class A beta-lactamase n=1 Tax=Microbacterium albipurpureum TaxID=3050384 RepID=UPI00259D0D9F|nr:class A beta-lactamase [Microbacterium sp. ET2 (Ac-2212)]WJL94698.1 class A beta-lactamase [Microbacterium sp. ET2 (Ac-2212)]
MKTIARARALAGAVLATSVLLIAPACAPSMDMPDAATPTSTPTSTSTPMPTPSAIDLSADLGALEERYEARIGIYALDTETGETVAHRADERFAYASTFKALLAGVILQEIDDLDRVVTYGSDALVSYSPITERYVEAGLSVRELAEAAVRTSDNTAANLLLDQLGGPEGFAAALARSGDDITQPERREPELNSAVPGDPRDTSTPRALVETLRQFAFGDLLEDADKTTLIEWMSGNSTGDTLIRAGAPEGSTVADKSGTGGHGTRNDIGIVWPPDGEPIVIAVLTTRDVADAATDDALVAEAAAVALAGLTEDGE